ncbi:MAG: phosphoribosyl-ATP diphosphatase [Spirochaetaceae bacterium]|nr:MAG: phosphoribosyl-ATP diphosphatase [Spirochaetaceae bacterium]
MNKKAHAKSLENNTIWLFHPETGRVLPYGDAGFQSLKTVGARYEAIVNAANLPAETRAPDDPAAEHSESAPETSEASTSGPADPTRVGSIITELAGIVEDRLKTMPEGSYTTHLFTQGPDKIRKKMGEEAVELILARDEAEIVYEAADLVYHMLVLFAALGIPITRIFDELASRAK